MILPSANFESVNFEHHTQLRYFRHTIQESAQTLMPMLNGFTAVQYFIVKLYNLSTFLLPNCIKKVNCLYSLGDLYILNANFATSPVGNKVCNLSHTAHIFIFLYLRLVGRSKINMHLTNFRPSTQLLHIATHCVQKQCVRHVSLPE